MKDSDITLLETLGNRLTNDDDDDGVNSQAEVLQWLGVVHAMTNGDMAQAVNALPIDSFGADIVRLAGSLRSVDVVGELSKRVKWNSLIHPQTFPTGARSYYHKHSFRNSLLGDLTETNFWIRSFGTDNPDNDTFDNIAFVFHTAFEHGAFSFQHPVYSELFGKEIPFGTAVVAHELGQRFHIFEQAPFSNIPIEDQADFMVAGCLHLGARDNLNPEERTLGYGQENTLLATLEAIDIHQMYSPSVFLQKLFGWDATPLPLGVVALSLLSGASITFQPTVRFAQRICEQLDTNSTNRYFPQTMSALIFGGRNDVGPIKNLIVDHFFTQADTKVVQQHFVKIGADFDTMDEEQKNRWRRIVLKAVQTPLKNQFDAQSVPELLAAAWQIFGTAHHNDRFWGGHQKIHHWWNPDTGFDHLLKWFDPSVEQTIVQYMEPYVAGAIEIGLNARDFSNNPSPSHMRALLLWETFAPQDIFTPVAPEPRKAKI